MTVFRRPSRAAAAGDAIPFAHGDELHLFYLSSPPGTRDHPERVRTTWQHARAGAGLDDWTELPPALEPGPPGAVDAGGAWTGSVVEHDGTFHLFYTGHDPDAANPQTICLATSTDLVTFTKHPGNPLLLPPAGCEPVDWRDPYVFFHPGEGRWWMLIAARLADGPHWRRGCIMLATSADLLTWSVEPEPLYVPGTTYCPECPELWELGGRWYLVFSRFSEDAGTVYRVADDPRGPFRIPADDELGGRRWYAARSAPAPGSGGAARAFFGWVHDRVGTDAGPRWLWGGDVAAPRLVTADGDGALRVALAPPVAARFARTTLDATERLDAVGTAVSRLAGGDPLPGACLIRATLSFAAGGAAGVLLATGADHAGWYVTADRRRDELTLTREPRPLDDFWADLTGRPPAYREIDGAVLARARLAAPTAAASVRLDLLLDGDVLEIYADDRVALTHRIERTGPLLLGAFATDTDARAVLTVTVAG